MLRRFLYKSSIILIIYIQVSGLYGCMKEYSYEGGPGTDPIVVPPHDTVVNPPKNGLPFCAGCNNANASADLFWSFRYDTSLLCGSVTNSVITPDRDGFTFFGPSTCSLDTGLVMTVFLSPEALNTDKLNITTTNVSLEYYDNTGFSDVFVSNHHLISFTIGSYVHSSGIARGTFEGLVKAKDNTLVPISQGKFTIQFK